MKRLLLTAICTFSLLFAFSQDYRLDELRAYYWGGDTPDWQQYETRHYSYANGGTKETLIKSTYFPSSENSYQIEKSYNDNTDLAQTINMEWDDDLMDWVIYSKVVYDYDTSNRLISETEQLYDAGTTNYTDDFRLVYTYSDELLMSITSQFWNADTEVWEDEDKGEMTYTDGILTERLASYWNNLDSEWYWSDRDILTYNEDDMLVEWLRESYSVIDEVWEWEDRSLPTYTGQLETELLNQNWTGTDWVNSARRLNTYDANDNNTIFVQESWDQNTEEWIPQYKEEKDYSLVVASSVKDTEVYNLKVYPNPVKDILNLEFNLAPLTSYEAQVYGIDGRLIQSEMLGIGGQSFQLHLPNLQSGMYLLTFKGMENLTYKIVKE